MVVLAQSGMRVRAQTYRIRNWRSWVVTLGEHCPANFEFCTSEPVSRDRPRRVDSNRFFAETKRLPGSVHPLGRGLTMKTLIIRHVDQSDPAQFQVVRLADGKSVGPVCRAVPGRVPGAGASPQRPDPGTALVSGIVSRLPLPAGNRARRAHSGGPESLGRAAFLALFGERAAGRCSTPPRANNTASCSCGSPAMTRPFCIGPGKRCAIRKRAYGSDLPSRAATEQAPRSASDLRAIASGLRKHPAGDRPAVRRGRSLPQHLATAGGPDRAAPLPAT